MVICYPLVMGMDAAKHAGILSLIGITGTSLLS